MAKYVGKRVVPKHCGAWTKNKEYEMLSIVLADRLMPFLKLFSHICDLLREQRAD